MRKCSRPLVLFLTLLVSFSFFTVGTSAASGNLINSDITTWDKLNNTVTVTKSQGIYHIEVSAITDTTIVATAIMDNFSIIAGHSYTLQFKIPSLAEISSAFYTVTTSNLQNCLTDTTVSLALASTDGETIDFISTQFNITKNNVANFIGKSSTASFVASSYSGTPCFSISFGGTALNNSHRHLFLKDLVLVDNDDNSSELTGIKGFLHSIRWEIVGGYCTDDDCPHNATNGTSKHTSLSEKFSASITNLSQSVSDYFSDMGNMFEDLGNWLTDGFSAIGNGISSGVTSVSGFFDSLGLDLNNWFSDVGDWFTNLDTNIGNWFTNLGNNISGFFDTLWDNFNTWLDKFKPRIYEEFIWVTLQYIRADNGLINEGSNRYQFSSVSDFFTVPSGTKYIVNYRSC